MAEASNTSCLPTSNLKDSVINDDEYKMMVLRFSPDTTEDEVDQQLLQAALHLSINVPQHPTSSLDSITKNVSALNINSISPEHGPPPSRTSDSTHPASCSSSEQRGHTKTSSVTSASMTSPPSSIHSNLSHRSSYTKIKKGIRRFSTMRRRRTIDAQIPPIPIAAITVLRPTAQHRPVSIDQIPSKSIVSKPIPYCTPEISPSPVVCPPTGSPDFDEDDPAARSRSRHHPRLKQFRWSQLEEQRRFIRFEADQHRLMHSRQLDTERRILAEHPQKLKALSEKHAEALSSLENRHLSAEVDLERTLETERQACETRLKHMQAYCNPRYVIEGMPNRVVTKQHHRQLEQQRHARNGMDNLHTARINVLREKQAKQLERIVGKQEAEIEAADLDLSTKMQALEARRESEKEMLKNEFLDRRRRLTKRWELAEAVERRKLENETGEAYGSLPPIEWDESRGGEEDDGVDSELAKDALAVCDAATLNMF
ncbi:MAG: hypothetical protein Q9174_001346 [Haloplaca sp. 1 TL-2023]